jgi:hypothetical protein
LLIFFHRNTDQVTYSRQPTTLVYSRAIREGPLGDSIVVDTGHPKEEELNKETEVMELTKEVELVKTEILQLVV